MKCIKCGNDVPENYSFCPNCGTKQKIRKRICPRCGLVALPTDKECDECGYPFPEYHEGAEPENKPAAVEEPVLDDYDDDEDEGYFHFKESFLEFLKKRKKTLLPWIVIFVAAVIILWIVIAALLGAMKNWKNSGSNKVQETIGRVAGNTVSSMKVIEKPSKKEIASATYDLLQSRSVNLTGKLYFSGETCCLNLYDPVSIHGTGKNGNTVLLKDVSMVAFAFKRAQVGENAIRSIPEGTKLMVKGKMSLVDQKPYIFPDEVLKSSSESPAASEQNRVDMEPWNGPEAEPWSDSSDWNSGEFQITNGESAVYGAQNGENPYSGSDDEFWNAVRILENYNVPSEILGAIRGDSPIREYSSSEGNYAVYQPNNNNSNSSDSHQKYNYNPYGSYYGYGSQNSGGDNYYGSNGNSNSYGNSGSYNSYGNSGNANSYGNSANYGSSANYSSSDYILPNSSSMLLTDADIRNLSLRDLNYAKNEIYARHGRIFDSPELREYFSSKSWYRGTIDGDHFSDALLTQTELDNIDLLREREYSLNPDGYPLD